MGQMKSCPVQECSLHQWKTSFANLEDDLYFAGPTSGTLPHRTPLSTAWRIAQRKMQRAVWIARLYSAITQPFSIQNSPNWWKCPLCCFLSTKQVSRAFWKSLLSKTCVAKLLVPSTKFRVKIFLTNYSISTILTIESSGCLDEWMICTLCCHLEKCLYPSKKSFTFTVWVFFR